MWLRSNFFLLAGLLIISCSDPQEDIESPSENETIELFQNEFTEEQEEALDALDIIQMSGWSLYSTFPNHIHDCNGNIDTFIVTQDQFRSDLLHLLNLHYLDLPVDERTELATAASKAQETYVIKTCGATADNLILDKTTDPPKSGTWIFQALLNQRDLIIKW